MTQHYIGIKQVTAWPEEKDGQPGYAVMYLDGYTSWSPKATFERFYLPMGEESDGTKITPEMVENFLVDVQDDTFAGKVTTAIATLANGFVLTESSGCVDAANYDHELGVQRCRDRFTRKTWELLAFVLHWARAGIQPAQGE
jgi:hypothetical protein